MRVATGFLSLAVLVAAGMGACGGQSVSSDDGHDDPVGGSGGTTAGKPGGGGSGAAPGGSGNGQGGSSSGRGSGSAGTSTSGGSFATGGSGNASGTGAGNAAGASASGGTGGAGRPSGTGGQPIDNCLEPAQTGSCSAAFERWFFNGERGICETFIYGGCGATYNNFETLEECSAACAGRGKTDPTACEMAQDCVLTAAQCCGGNDPPALGDVTAVNAKHLEEFTAPCQLVDCASTIGKIPSYFGATCHQGHCIPFAVHRNELTECEQHSDCVLRNGLSCCEGCGMAYDDFVAIRKDKRGLTDLVCDGPEIACPACDPIPPPELGAECSDGHCTLVPLPVSN